MSSAFAILFDKKYNLESIVYATKDFFNLSTSYRTEKLTTLVNKDYNLVLKISPQKLKFIIAEDEDLNLENISDNIHSFINRNFVNDTIGYKHYCGNFHFNKKEFNDVSIIDIQ